MNKQEISNGTLIDVRSIEEFAQGHHPDSLNIPLDQLEHALVNVHQYTAPIYLCCASGIRSDYAAKWLRNQGIDAVNVGGWESLLPDSNEKNPNVS